MPMAKVLAIGGPAGNHSRFVAAIGDVKVRSSNGDGAAGVVPMDFGHITLEDGLQLQIFGVPRDNTAVMAQALEPGVVGAVVIVDDSDLRDPHFTQEAIEALDSKQIPAAVLAVSDSLSPEGLRESIDIGDRPATVCQQVSRQAAKQAILSVLEAALESSQGSAA